MQLLLVRHAIAFERNRRRWPDDSKRPLTPAGARRFRRAAEGLAKIARTPQRVLSSPYVRAVQTAAILTEAAGWPAPRQCDELAPGGSIDGVLGVLREYKVQRIALVGHEPDLSALVAALVTRGAGLNFKMKKGAVACLEFAGRPARGRASLFAYLPPKILRSIR
jgi:phosphohistidine phosphatase